MLRSPFQLADRKQGSKVSCQKTSQLYRYSKRTHPYIADAYIHVVEWVFASEPLISDIEGKAERLKSGLRFLAEDKGPSQSLQMQRVSGAGI
jgi:hypothetical protein